MGNGDEASGDGYHYRGRGLIQLTGKTNCLEPLPRARGRGLAVAEPPLPAVAVPPTYLAQECRDVSRSGAGRRA